jgi:hypothetical protein
VPDEVAERVTVAIPRHDAYHAVANVRRLVRWSPECFAYWVRSGRDGELGQRWVGFNRRGRYVWFTTSEVVVAVPGEEFAFDVSAFGQPVSRWGYRFAAVEGGTEITEYWLDRRSEAVLVMGRRFTGPVADVRPQANAEGMRATLARLKRELEAR